MIEFVIHFCGGFLLASAALDGIYQYQKYEGILGVSFVSIFGGSLGLAMLLV